MHLNDLPNECLFIIFRHLNGLEDLANCGKVCSRWNHLVAHRFLSIHYLSGVPDPAYPFRTIHFGLQTDLLKDAAFWLLIPNVKILEITSSNGLNYEDMINILVHAKSLKGLIYSPVMSKVMARYCGNLEMIATKYSKTFFFDIIIQCGSKLKQLNICFFNLRHLERFARYLPSLQRLHINDTSGETGHLYFGPSLENLRILELSMESFDKSQAYSGFHLVDFCPSLTSAYFILHGAAPEYFFEETKHYCLRDLVIQYEVSLDSCYSPWPHLMRLMSKFPNLRHVAIRGNFHLEMVHIQQLINLLPDLTILDLRSSLNDSVSSLADNITSHCKKSKRFVSIYLRPADRIDYDWPELSISRSRIGLRFDFMQNCFLKSFEDLPLLLDPID